MKNDNNYIITFARGFGSGGKEIARKVAKELNIACYENQILKLASDLSGIDEETFDNVNEKLADPNSITQLLKAIPKTKNYLAKKQKFQKDDELFSYQKRIIENLAETCSCVIVGKCADDILKDNYNVVSIYIEAPRSFCINRTMENMKVSEPVAINTIVRTDKYRTDYYKYYTKGKDWRNPINYDMTINSEMVGIDNCVKLIISYLKIKFPEIEI